MHDVCIKDNILSFSIRSTNLPLANCAVQRIYGGYYWKAACSPAKIELQILTYVFDAEYNIIACDNHIQ